MVTSLGSMAAAAFFCAALSSSLLPPAASQQLAAAPGELEAFSPAAVPPAAVMPPAAAQVDAAAPNSVDSAAPSAAAPALAPAVVGQVAAPPGTIQRTTKQQVLATLPPGGANPGSEPFLSSPSGKYAGYLLRRETVHGAGGFGNDFCYIQVRDAGTGQSLWESDCAPVSLSNACTLLFTQAGLEVFDGSRSAWDSGVDAEHLETLELVDQGDMRIRTRDGELAWKASDSPLANQRCGAPGSPGLPSGLPPFAAPVEDNRNLPFGQPAAATGGGGGAVEQDPLAAPVHAGEQNFQQPLVDNTPFDSAGGRVTACRLALALALPLLGLCL